jgi:hypothetical protein
MVLFLKLYFKTMLEYRIANAFYTNLDCSNLESFLNNLDNFDHVVFSKFKFLGGWRCSLWWNTCLACVRLSLSSKAPHL